uniref:Putative tick transposon n=1 Tax=Rhipicephalus pulchellus TaxID=72859 RepID=L7LXN1_RHIPC
MYMDAFVRVAYIFIGPVMVTWKLRKVEAYLKDNALAVLPADKEGWFAVLSYKLFNPKASEAVSSVFKSHDNVVISKVKPQAKKLCEKLNLSKLVSGIANSKKVCLEVFFSVKTHKPEKPFRVIVSENGTWQKSVALFLQSKLGLLAVEDLFLVKNSGQVLDFIRPRSKQRMCGFSIDIKDLYYSLPHESILSCVEESIDKLGSITFQNSAGVSSSSFLELLSFYLKSTFIQWNGKPHLQKEGICIGSCIAPILSDLFFAKLDRTVSGDLSDYRSMRIFRFVDDFLILLDCDPMSCALDILNFIKERFKPLVLTHELPVNNTLRFLDIALIFHLDHTCWTYKPRSN